MKLLVITPHRYGIREVAERVGAEWESMGHEVDYELARGAAARVGPVTVGTPGIAWWWYKQFDRLVDSDYDLIWSHQPVLPMLPTKHRELWDRVVVTFHTTMRAEYELVKDGDYPKRLLPFHWLTKTLEARTHLQLEDLDASGPHYTVISSHLRDELAAFGVRNTVEIPNGIFTPDRETFEPIRAQYDIPEDATLVFNIGSLTPQKRPVKFANLMRDVTDQDDSVYCVIAGKGPLADEVAEYTTDRLRTVGYVSDQEKWRWFTDADVFASLAAYEGMPVATLEALSFGIPAVLSDIPAHQNLIETYTSSAKLVSDDSSEILHAINRLKGADATVSLPGWPQIAEMYLEHVGPLVQSGVVRNTNS